MRAQALVAVVFVLSMVARALGAQATTVMLHGTIVSSDGAVPAGSSVEVVSRETGAARAVTPDAAGRYRLLGLAPGAYDVTVRALGYRPHRRSDVRLVLGQDVELVVVLATGAAELAPVVVAADADANGRRTDVSTAVLQEEIARLPLNTRNVLNLAAIAPGIRTFAPEGGRSIPAAGALPSPRFVNLYVDGLEWKGTLVGTVLGQPALGSVIPQEAVREFRVALNPYDVEYTRSGSWLISAVTHRGSNRLEGSLFGHHQNATLIAKSSFQATRPDYRRHQIGGNLRGPLVRDRLFFSLSYEGLATDDHIDVVPGRPAANPVIWDSLGGSFRAPVRGHGGVLRLTAPRGAHTIDAMWATRHVVTEAGFGTRPAGVMLAREAGLITAIRLNSVQLTDTYVSSAFLHELSVHLLDNTNDEVPLVPGPTFQYPGIQVGRPEFPLFIDTRHLRVSSKSTLVSRGPAGAHTLKWGVEATRTTLRSHRPVNREGVFLFATDTSARPRSALIGMGLDDPLSAREASFDGGGWHLGVYAQDQWEPTAGLTIAAGLRWDAEINTLNQRLVTPWATDPVLLQTLGEDYLNDADRENDLDNLSPRFSVAWELSRGTVLRAGFGTMYMGIPIIGAQDEKLAVGWRTYEFQDPGTTDPAELRQRVLEGEGTRRPAAIVLLKDRLETPVNRQWSAGISRRLTSDLSINLDYLEQRTTNVAVTVNANWLNPDTRQRAITNAYASIIVWDDFGDARFRALLASIVYARPGVRVNAAYTLGWARSEFAELTTTDYPDPASYVMQRADGDERHRIVLSGFTTLPGGVELSGIAVAASPRPFLVRTGSDDNRNGTPRDDWPGGARTRRRGGWEHWYRTLDVRVSRSFAVPRGRLAVMVEGFNVLNSANHAEYQGTASQLVYGEPVGDYARRQVQLGVRWVF